MLFKRYGIYLADLSPTRGGEMSKTRPVVIVSLDAMNQALETVVVCPLTTRLHPTWRSRIQITRAGKEAEIAVDQIRTLTRERLVRKVDSLADTAANELRQLISEMYGDG